MSTIIAKYIGGDIFEQPFHNGKTEAENREYFHERFGPPDSFEWFIQIADNHDWISFGAAAKGWCERQQAYADADREAYMGALSVDDATENCREVYKEAGRA